jgi:hypothetical protein
MARRRDQKTIVDGAWRKRSCLFVFGSYTLPVVRHRETWLALIRAGLLSASQIFAGAKLTSAAPCDTGRASHRPRAQHCLEESLRHISAVARQAQRAAAPQDHRSGVGSRDCLPSPNVSARLNPNQMRKSLHPFAGSAGAHVPSIARSCPPTSGQELGRHLTSSRMCSKSWPRQSNYCARRIS